MKHRALHIICCALLCILFSASVLAAPKPYLAPHYEVTGIDNDAVKKNVNLTLQNFRSSLHFPLTQEEMHHFYKKAPKLIQNAVTPYGYFRSQVQSSLTKTAKNWNMQFHVTLGPALLIRSIDVRVEGAGKTDHKFQQLLTQLPFHVGSPLETEAYESVKTKLYDLATERGYFQGKMVKKQIRINLTDYYARVILVFDTGPRYRFGPTTFSKSPFREKFLKRFLRYQEKHHYNAKRLTLTQVGLVASNYFNQVTIKPELGKAVNGYVPVHIALTMRKKKAYTIGLGYGTDTGGIRGTLGYSLRYIGHEGHRFHTLLRASPHNSSLTAKYIIPGFHPARDLFTIGGGVGNMEQSTGNARNAKFALGYTIFSGHWKNSLTLAYLNERYNIVNLPKTSTQLVYPTLETKYTNTDHVTHPHKGITLEMQLTGADKNVLSQTDFFQETFHFNSLYTLEETHTRLLFRSDLGHTDITNLIRLPLSLQLFAGGAKSVRGYGYNSIGPGRNLVVASAEVQQKMIGALYLTAFIDSGVVGDKNIFHHINAGTGPGVAWVSSIGTIELTVAQAFTQSNKPWTIQFTMGTAI